MTLRQILFVAGIVAALVGLLPAPAALAAGIALGVGLGNPWPAQSSRAAKKLLQAAVVGLGFGVPLADVWDAGRTGVVVTLVGIAATLLLGRLLGRALAVRANTADLITVGTAICGGSAIAAMAPVLGADDDEISVSIASVFALNAVALFLFPPLGHLLGLTERQFGYWAAIAIHDTSSVVAAGAIFGTTAVGVATTVKLARAVWIAPLTLAAGWARKRTGRTAFPWFILGFVAAAALRSAAPDATELWGALTLAARRVLVATLFLIGAGMTRQVIARVGARPLIFAVVLWVLVSVASLAAISLGAI